MPANINPPATRTHARRSCEICKARKTRCELPDVNVQSSTEPQPLEFSCHRCRTLVLPCVVNDEGRKRGLPVQEGSQRKRKKRADSDVDKDHGQSKQSKGVVISALEPPATHHDDRDRQLLHTFLPYENERTTLVNGESSRRRLPDISPPKKRVDTIRLHGKPWRLACAMLGAAYGKGPPTLDLDSLLSEEMRQMLHSG